MRKVVLNKQALTGYTIYQTCPIGTVLDFAGTSIPNGFFLCDGRELLRSEYKELFKVIGTTFGEGNGITTFNIPDTIEKVVEGANARTIGKKYKAGLPNITGNISNEDDGYGAIQGHSSKYNGAFKKSSGKGTASWSGSTTGSFNLVFDASSSNPIYGNSDTVQMDAVGMYKIIKAKNYISEVPAGEGETKVIANPAVRGTEPQLTSLQVGEQKYIVGSSVLDNLQDMILTMCGALGELRYFPDKEYHRGFLCCDGRTFLPKVYPEFFAFWKTHFEKKCGYDRYGYPRMPDYSGRYIRGTEAGETPFDLEYESLPNITGTVGGYGSASGAFVYGGSQDTKTRGASTGEALGSWFNFNAHLSSSTIGRNKKKPNSVVVNNVNSYIFIKAI